MRPPSRAMTPMEQMDIIKGCETVEGMDEVESCSRDLEVSRSSYCAAF